MCQQHKYLGGIEGETLKSSSNKSLSNIRQIGHSIEASIPNNSTNTQITEFVCKIMNFLPNINRKGFNIKLEIPKGTSPSEISNFIDRIRKEFDKIF